MSLSGLQKTGGQGLAWYTVSGNRPWASLETAAGSALWQQYFLKMVSATQALGLGQISSRMFVGKGIWGKFINVQKYTMSQ